MSVKKRPGTLILVPTPLSPELPLEPVALERLKQALQAPVAPVILFEEIKPARRRWLQWGLPRETIEQFVLYNEHGQESMVPGILQSLQEGRDVFLMSDGGLPAFCDPGQQLVRACHESHVPVTATPFPNSVMLALALSGLPHEQFTFAGFLPRQSELRRPAIASLLQKSGTFICMDTAYRLGKSLKEFVDLGREMSKNPLIFLAMDLNRPEQSSYWGGLLDAERMCLDLDKKDFILVLSNG